jgi:hypothetical protein
MAITNETFHLKMCTLRRREIMKTLTKSVDPKFEYIKMSFGHVIRKRNSIVYPLIF